MSQRMVGESRTAFCASQRMVGGSRAAFCVSQKGFWGVGEESEAVRKVFARVRNAFGEQEKSWKESENGWRQLDGLLHELRTVGGSRKGFCRVREESERVGRPFAGFLEGQVALRKAFARLLSDSDRVLES